MLEKKAETFNMNRVIDDFDEMTRNADQVQKQTLKEILHKNKSAIYLRNFGINGDTTTDPEEDFKALVPLVTDSELEPYIKRMVDGDTSPILTGHPVPAISLRFSFLQKPISKNDLFWWLCYSKVSLFGNEQLWN